eukprot:TRINITY_DN10610_c0_g1_i2.p1 TRINITY_DN10610_c0_g1~~TRINITY_DN10610_c0_g1_i2.p1  ORF type:complete len:391 (+),score=83.37 TRINITY_DN10610_c0_g1_i2:43-1173(+)
MAEEKRSTCMETEAGILRGPSPGQGRSAFVCHDGLVWTVGVPADKTPEDSVAEQTRKALQAVDDRLAQAGTDKSRILEATVFVKEMTMKEEMDSVWRTWVPEGCGISRACVSTDLAPGDFVEIKVTAALNRDLEIVRGPSPGPGRSAFVSYAGLVWTVAVPADKTAEDSVAEQTQKALTALDERLALAGTDKSRILEATIYVKEMAMKDEMDPIWRAWVPEGAEISRACVSADLAPGVFVEMKVTAALKSDLEIIRGPVPAAGSGRSAFTSLAGRVWTVGFPKGFAPEDTVAEQTQKSLKVVDDRLALAGTDKSHILEATVFVKEMAMKEEMDSVWREWVPEGCGVSRACVSADLASGFFVEIKFTAALPPAAAAA